MNKKIYLLLLMSVVGVNASHSSTLNSWWRMNIGCYFAHGGELTPSEQSTGRYDVVLFPSSTATNSQNPRVYLILDKLRGFFLIN